MRCPYCGREVPFHEASCGGCGRDLTIFRKVVSASNAFYNDGLAKARVRDLSGAIESLRKSLKLDKRNTDARNLLGLVYYEVGEVVLALSQWVISKNFQPESNAADGYMADIQRSPARLESINQTIKKYNNALEHAKQGGGDMAIVQLENVVRLNPRFVRSYQLLGLLYMQRGEWKKAARSLMRARKIDRNNTLTLYYIEQLPQKSSGHGSGERGAAGGQDLSLDGSQDRLDGSLERSGRSLEGSEGYSSGASFSKPAYAESKVSIWPYLNLVLGAVLGIAVSYFLLVPTAKEMVAAEYEGQITEYNDELSSKDVEITGLQHEIDAAREEQESFQEEIDRLSKESEAAKESANFYDAIWKYMSGDEEGAATELEKVKKKSLSDSTAKDIYESIQSKTFQKTAEDLAEQGRVAYNSGRYEDAMKMLDEAVGLDPDNVKALYFLGRCYHRTGDYEKAREYYSTIVDEYPDSDRASEAASRLRELPSQ